MQINVEAQSVNDRRCVTAILGHGLAVADAQYGVADFELIHRPARAGRPDQLASQLLDPACNRPFVWPADYLLAAAHLLCC